MTMINKSLDKMIIGTAFAFAATAIIPIARSTFRPLAEAGLQRGADLCNLARSYAQKAKEEVEDIVAEAQFERLKRQLEKDISDK